MLRIFMVSFCFIVIACSASGEQPEISFTKVSKISKPTVDIFPSYKFKDETRLFLEVSFASSFEVITFSLRKDMVPRVIIGTCTDFNDVPGLAFPNLYLDGKTIENFTKNVNEPSINEMDNTTYQAYINYLEYEKLILDNVDAELCLQVRGASYSSSFKSNIVKIPTDELK